jgi:hypothetical protein
MYGSGEVPEPVPENAKTALAGKIRLDKLNRLTNTMLVIRNVFVLANGKKLRMASTLVILMLIIAQRSREVKLTPEFTFVFFEFF